MKHNISIRKKLHVLFFSRVEHDTHSGSATISSLFVIIYQKLEIWDKQSRSLNLKSFSREPCNNKEIKNLCCAPFNTFLNLIVKP